MGSLQALRVVDGRLERAVGATDEAHERREGAQMRAPFAEEDHLGSYQRWDDEHRPGDIAPAEQRDEQKHHGEREARGAHEAEHREPEDGRGKQGASQDDVARIGWLAIGAGGASTRARGLQGALLGSGKGCGLCRCRARPRGGLGCGGATKVAPYGGGVVALLEDAAQLAPHGHGAEPPAEGAAQKQDGGHSQHDGDDRSRHEHLAGEHGAQGSDRADKRNRFPAEG